MPNTQSAIKALRQNKRRHAQNLKRKEAMKDVIKKYKKAIEAGKKDEAAKMLPDVYKKLDKMTKVNVIKKNKASRLKSRLTRRLSKQTP
ncbi:MAG: 30S ribosomal protein S20 [Nanoarchaeota archaeon]|nr:30S ribosomal protein S20 [Nanoarchaeota archaeon]